MYNQYIYKSCNRVIVITGFDRFTNTISWLSPTPFDTFRISLQQNKQSFMSIKYLLYSKQINQYARDTCASFFLVTMAIKVFAINFCRRPNGS